MQMSDRDALIAHIRDRIAALFAEGPVADRPGQRRIAT
jgi:hypothetical protein